MKKSMRWVTAMLLVFGLMVLPIAAMGVSGPVITQPNGGEFFKRGEVHVVEWSGYPDATFHFYLSTDSGANYDTHLGSGNGGSFYFMVPQVTTSKARIKMTGIIGMTKSGIGSVVPVIGSDESNADFRIGFAFDAPITPIVPIDPGDLVPFPTEPENLVVGADGSVLTHDLSWEHSASSEDGFNIYRRHEEAVAFTKIATVGANVFSGNDPGPLTVGDTYFYKVSSFNTIGESWYSNTYEYVAPGLMIGPDIPLIPVDPTPDPEAEDETDEVTPVTIELKIGETTYEVNGVDHEMDVAPQIIEGRTVLPIRYLANPLGADVGWVAEERKAIVSRGPVYLELWIGNPMAANKGMPIPIDPYNDDVTPIIVPPGRTMLPLRFIAERLGCMVNYDRMDQSIEVIYPIP